MFPAGVTGIVPWLEWEIQGLFPAEEWEIQGCSC